MRNEQGTVLETLVRILGFLDTNGELLNDLFLLTGWYHAISFCARAARVDLEPGAPTFATFAVGRPDGSDRAGVSGFPTWRARGGSPG